MDQFCAIEIKTFCLTCDPIRGNDAMENFLLHNRERWGCKCIPVHKTARNGPLNINQKVILTGFEAAKPNTTSNIKILDQFFWSRKNTISRTQIENYLQVRTNPYFFSIPKKSAVGADTKLSIWLFRKSREVEQKEILLAYVRKAEEIIRQEPEYYLWSHRRWKHSRPEGTELTM